jgi:hypothetical protein
METLVNQQLSVIKELEDLEAALEEELEAATSCQEVDNSQLLNVSKDHEADLVKFCKDLGESSREQTLEVPELVPENFQEVPEKVTSQEVRVDDEVQEELLLPSESLEAG